MSAPKRPNILLILTDQWHPRFLAHAGHPVLRTPHLDTLAAQGAVCSRMYTPNPLCMPARASLFTGMTPRAHGVRMNGIPLNPNIPTFVSALSNGGYRTHGVGKMHLGVVAVPKGLTADALDPLAYPECAALWKAGKIKETPRPFYGFESFQYATGHGFRIEGEYMQWLEREHPASAQMVRQATPTEPPSPAFQLFNREAYKWALPAEHHPTTWVVDQCLEFLQQHASSDSQTSAEEREPFFLCCSINDPHSPFAAPVPYCDAYHAADMPPPLESEGELDALPPHFKAMVQDGILTSGNVPEPMMATRPYHAECAAQYCGMIQLIDDQVGRLMAALKAGGLEEDTLVVFTADHGEALGDHGLWGKGPYHIDGVIRVPFLVKWPSRIPPGSTIDTPCSLLDLAPTFLHYAGLEFPGSHPVSPAEAGLAPPPFPGKNLSQILEGRATISDRGIVVESDEDYLGLRLRTLVTGRYRMTMYAGQDYGELFDLQEDPEEFHNLWDQPTAFPIREHLRKLLLDEVIRTDSCLPRQISRA